MVFSHVSQVWLFWPIDADFCQFSFLEERWKFDCGRASNLEGSYYSPFVPSAINSPFIFIIVTCFYSLTDRWKPWKFPHHFLTYREFVFSLHLLYHSRVLFLVKYGRVHTMIRIGGLKFLALKVVVELFTFPPAIIPWIPSLAWHQQNYREWTSETIRDVKIWVSNLPVVVVKLLIPSPKTIP